MKRILLLFIVITLILFKANGQITRGNWLVGGNMSFTASQFKSDISPRQKNSLLVISPTVGYFLADKLATGLKVSFNSANQNDGTNSLKQQNFNFGPFLRYYFLSTENRANLFVDGIYQYGITNASSSSNLKLNTYSFSGGSSIFFNSNVAVEFSLGYSTTTYSNYNGVNSNIIAGIGLQFHLQRE